MSNKSILKKEAQKYGMDEKVFELQVEKCFKDVYS